MEGSEMQDMMTRSVNNGNVRRCRVVYDSDGKVSSSNISKTRKMNIDISTVNVLDSFVPSQYESNDIRHGFQDIHNLKLPSTELT